MNFLLYERLEKNGENVKMLCVPIRLNGQPAIIPLIIF